MSSIKYSNGMYKTTSKAQDKTAQNLFKSFHITITMGCQFDQLSGNASYFFYNTNDVEFLWIIVNRKGNIL